MSAEDTVIDNEKVVLLDQLRGILPDTNRASIAVGYFFISGFGEIMDSLHKIEASDDPNHIIRLMISPTTNRATAEALLASNESYDVAKLKSKEMGSEEEGRESARTEVKKTLEYMSQREMDQRAAAKLAELIRKKKVQVKVYTKDQLHAKAYIFELDNRQLQKMAIVGSSNLSISGIKEHTELNLRTNHSGDSQKLLEWFDRHWNDPTCQEFTRDIADIIGESWVAKHSPSDVYNKAVLYEHDELTDDAVGDGDARELFDFQKSAVGNAIKKLDKYGGVMIADVVGMGKSYIGSAILKYLKENNRSKPLIICPPHLKDMWRAYMDDFGIYCAIESRYQIGMDNRILPRHSNCDVVLIDESHNFRNSDTNSYRELLAFMEEKTEEARIIMLSATPIANGVTDLKNQLKLFPQEMLLRIPPLNDTTLDKYFEGLEGSKSKIQEDADIKIRDLLRYILIRRTRKQIIEKYAGHEGTGDHVRHYLEKDGEKKYFPKRKLQNPEEYNIDRVYNSSFQMIESAIESLTLARYAPGNYIRDEYLDGSHPDHRKYADLNSTTKPLVGIVRTSLLKRMESSIMAFASSVGHYQEGYKEFLKQLDKGLVPIGPEFRDEIYKKISYEGEDYDSDYERRIGEIKPKYDINAFDVTRWRRDILEDINRFSSIRGNLVPQSEFTKHDDKLHTLAKLIDARDHQEKILIFSESAVTAKYIHKYLEKELKPARRIEQIDSKQRTKEKNDRVERFDPKNNNADIPKSREIDVLISTDVLSEGVNLQAGKTVINYDFHWNPVRLIQRVGRIDRIGSEHNTVDVINFLPTSTVERTLSLQERVANKIETIRRIIGHDQHILDATEAVDSDAVSDIYAGNEDVLDSNISSVIDVGESKSERDANRIKKDDTKRRQIEQMPFGIRSVSGRDKLLIACEADEVVVDRQQNRSISKRTYRRHYEVTQDEITRIWPSSFLNQLGEHKGNAAGDEEPAYNEFVAAAWKEFDRDMKNSSAKKSMLKHQKYFDKKLRQLSEHPDVGRAALSLLPFIGQRMLTNYQPYRKLTELRKRIDRDPDMGKTEILAGLEKIREQYRDKKYEKIISKPRILYSMMVPK